MSKTSGHDFQYKIEERVIAKGWETFSEQNYIDDVELKPRDNDFVAIRQIQKTNPRGNQLALVVECKYLPSDVHVYVRLNPKDIGAYFIDGYNKTDLFLDKNRFHFLSFPDVVTNVTLDDKKDKRDNLGAALIQSIKALLYFRGHGRKLDAKGLFYPLVVYGGPGKILDQNQNELKSFLYYKTYEYKEPYSETKVERRVMYVDVIHESDLEHYLENIFISEMDVIAGYQTFLQAISRKDSPPRQNPGL